MHFLIATSSQQSFCLRHWEFRFSLTQTTRIPQTNLTKIKNIFNRFSGPQYVANAKLTIRWKNK